MGQSTIEHIERIEVEGYRPDAVERTGRRMKMEYVGMGSVFLFIWLVDFSGVPHWSYSALATAGTVFLFMGLKKKTRDHLVTSFLLFAAAALAEPSVTVELWAMPYALFGACTWAMEGYLEKRRNRILALPAVIGGFAWTGPLWLFAFAFVAAYLLEPRDDLPGLRRKLSWLVAASAAMGLAVTAVAPWRGNTGGWAPRAPDGWELWLAAAVALSVVFSLVAYWRRLAWPHRVNGVLFTLLAPLDERFIAMFGTAGAIVLAATVFRQSTDSDRWRGAFRHAEWYFFPAILAVSVGLLVSR